MNLKLREIKGVLRAFVVAHYSTERILQTIDHIRSGQMVYCSCCCFSGIATADHPLCGVNIAWSSSHYKKSQELAGADLAEQMYYQLCDPNPIPIEDFNDDQSVRDRRLLPILLAELRRRSRNNQMIREELREFRA